MDNAKASWWQRHKPTTRRLIQLYSALLHNAHLKGFISGQIYQGKAKYACAPGLNCYSCPGAAGACPLGAIQNALASAGHSAGWYVLGMMLLFGVVLGRTVCGWLCPLGLLSNPMPANTGYFSMLGILFTRKFVIMVVIALACVFCYRAFCRFLCPLGAIYGLFNRFSIVGVKVDQGRCNHCGACVRGCGMDVRRVGDHECIQCGRCMDACRQGAIAVKAGKMTLKAPVQDGPDACERIRKRGRVLWGIALIALCLALLWFNVLDPAVKKEPMPGVQPAAGTEPAATEAPEAAEEPAPASTEVPEATEEPAPASTDTPEAAEEPAPAPAVSFDSDAPEGREPGEKLPDFTLPCYDGSEFHLAGQRGKIVFINLWATSCTPCKHELPYFNDLYLSHEGNIAVLVVHSSMVLDDPEAYLADKGYAMPFATDDDDDTLAEIVGSTGTFPQTVVLNRKGEVVYNKIGSVTPEMLSALYDEADRS